MEFVCAIIMLRRRRHSMYTRNQDSRTLELFFIPYRAAFVSAWLQSNSVLQVDHILAAGSLVAIERLVVD